jgi:DNA-binding MarR family transcriptional regulator
MAGDEKKSSDCNCQNLRRAAMVITKLYDDRLAASGLTACQYSLLKALESSSPCSVSALARQIRLDRTTLVRNLKPLEAAGYIADQSTPGERDHKLVLTGRGMDKCKETGSMWKEAQDAVARRLGPENLATLTALLLSIEQMEPRRAGNLMQEE